MPRPSQKFMGRIIQFVLWIIEGVDMEIELDPIASLFSARAHGGSRLGLRHPKPQARLNNPMTEKEPQHQDHEWEKRNRRPLTAPQPREDTNPKKLQLNFGSAKALAAVCHQSTIF